MYVKYSQFDPELLFYNPYFSQFDTELLFYNPYFFGVCIEDTLLHASTTSSIITNTNTITIIKF